MKSTLSLFVVATLLAHTHCYPGLPRDGSDSSEEFLNPNTDTMLVLPGQRFPIRPIFGGFPTLDDDDSDDGFGIFGNYGGNPFRNSFDRLLTSLQNAMNRVKEQMEGGLTGIGGLVPWSKIPEGANSTSTTKVIDGHVVTVNETVYQGENGDAFFRIRVVDVQPQDNSTTDEEGGEVTDKPATDNATTTSTPSEVETTTAARSVETVEDTGNNEIPTETLKA